MSTYFVLFYFYFILFIFFVYFVDLGVSGTECIVFHRKIAGSQVYGHKELILYFLWAKFGSYT